MPYPVAATRGKNFGFDDEINVVCPTVTPTLGSELVVNPGFEGVYEDESGGGGGTVMVAPNWNNVNCETNGTDTLAESATVHGGSSSQQINVDAANEGVATATSILATRGWYQVSAWIKRTSGTASILDGGGDIFISLASGTDWAQLITTGRTTATNRPLHVRASGGAANFLVDDASAKFITFATMLSLLGTRSQLNGTYICTPTVADGTQCGMVICYADADNYVLAVVDRGSNAADSARLYKMINGTWTAVTNGTITYSATAQLKVIVNNGNFSLYYDGTQEGTTQAIATATLGLQVHGFNAYDGNTVGLVVTSKSVNP